MNIDDEFFIEEIEDPKDKYVYNKLKNWDQLVLFHRLHTK
jgi:hypothetical protein